MDNKQAKAEAMKQVEAWIAKSKQTRQAKTDYNDKAIEVPSAWAHQCPYGLDHDDVETLRDWGII